MSELGDLLDDIVSGVDGTLLFSPSGSLYERFAAEGDPVVVSTENAVGAERYVTLPLEFDDIRERIRFGVEGRSTAASPKRAISSPAPWRCSPTILTWSRGFGRAISSAPGSTSSS